MSNKTKLKIGEFSKMMQVTVKTLRHYEQRGLLLPDEVDEWTLTPEALHLGANFIYTQHT